jgi:hypothetical protein
MTSQTCAIDETNGLIQQLLFAYVLIYVVAIPLIKLSILLFYRRIFGMNWVMWICAFLTVGYWFSCTIAFLVCCHHYHITGHSIGTPAGANVSSTCTLSTSAMRRPTWPRTV